MIFPRQRIPSSKKNKKWREEHLDWAEKTILYTADVYADDVKRDTLNYNLYSGNIDESDVEKTLNPDGLKYNDEAFSRIDKVKHYPVANKFINKLVGEITSEGINFVATVTNPDAISEIEKNKHDALYQRLLAKLQDTNLSDEQLAESIKEDINFIDYNWQDYREIISNCVLTHYNEQDNFNRTFTKGALDAILVNKEFYIVGIKGGEPTLERVDPRSIRLFRCTSNMAEDADVAVITEYWSPSKIIETYFDSLTPANIDAIEDMSNTSISALDNNVQCDQYFALKYASVNERVVTDYDNVSPFDSNIALDEPVDSRGNIRVIRMFWKSYDMVKQIKRPNPETGEFDIEYYSESYVADKDAGEEEKIFWVNRAWEGTKIGKDIYINIQPINYQLNSISNPSKCSIGIIGQIYSQNGTERMLSIMDMVKPYSYMYDVIHDKINKAMSRDLGKPIVIDFAYKPKEMPTEQWLYFLKNLGIYTKDSFNEDPNTPGRVAGSLNASAQNIANGDMSDQIAKYTQLLTVVDDEIGDIIGINRQRLGETGAREAAESISAASVQSSHITLWLVTQHFDVVKRTLDLFVNVARMCLKGKNKKFEYILPDGTKDFINVDGDMFYNCDYGVCLVNEAKKELDTTEVFRLAQAGIQTGAVKMSTIFKVMNTKSLSQKQRILENSEQTFAQQQQQMQQQQMQMQQQALEAEAAKEERKYQFEMQKLQAEIDARIKIAEINAEAEKQRFVMGDFGNIRKNDANLQIAEKNIKFQEKKLKEDAKTKDALIEIEKEKLEIAKNK